MDVPSFKLIRRKLYIKTVIKILMCLLIALMYLDGLHYPQCMCIFPDEILDLSFSLSPYQIQIEKGIFCEEENEQPLLLFEEIQKSSMWRFLKIKNNSLTMSLILSEFLLARCLKKKLSTLQQYNC